MGPKAAAAAGRVTESRAGSTSAILPDGYRRRTLHALFLDHARSRTLHRDDLKGYVVCVGRFDSFSSEPSLVEHEQALRRMERRGQHRNECPLSIALCAETEAERYGQSMYELFARRWA